MILNRQEISALIKEKEMVAGFINLATQLTSNGLDLTVAKVYAFSGAGALDFSNKERKLPRYKEILPKKKDKTDKFGWWSLKKGAYKIIANEVVAIPDDLIAMAFTRSSLLRMGVFTQTAVWDAGFCGRSEFILVVENPRGLKIKQNARIIQLLFCRINKTDKAYAGIYQTKV
ncbi:MAG: deoxyuridine 5'-triphosphate nucleotidohydrolase [Candidatus Omnitrophota bacterium]|nr:deoxyuridine 5'-triphosphate nucleotidohydrolase [Candidatus Omnitrophota bacterium]